MHSKRTCSRRLRLRCNLRQLVEVVLTVVEHGRCSTGLLYGAEALRAAAEFSSDDSAEHGRVCDVHRRVVSRRLSQRQAGLRQHRLVQLPGSHLHHLAARRHHIRHDTRRRHRYSHIIIIIIVVVVVVVVIIFSARCVRENESSCYCHDVRPSASVRPFVRLSIWDEGTSVYIVIMRCTLARI